MNWLYYLAEANLYLGVFYLAYCLFLAKETYYQLTRVYLLFACVASFTLPVLQIGALKPVEVAVTTTVNYTLPEYTAPQGFTPIITAPVAIERHLTVDDYLMYIYLAGAFIAFLMLMVKLLVLFRLMRNANRIKQDKHKLVYLPQTNVAFSFFNYLFIGTDAPGANTIIRHELVHIRQKHSVDIVFLELLKVVSWFNPFIYLLQNSLKTVHEYIADEQTAAYETDALTYSSFLVNNAYGTGGSSITHSFFNYNLLKKRIVMLNQKRSGNLARLKYLVAVPVCAGLLCASTLAFSKTYGWVDIDPAKALENTVSEQSVKIPASKPKRNTFPIPSFTSKGYEYLHHQIMKTITYNHAENDNGAFAVVGFDVANDGKLSNIKIEKSTNHRFDAQTLNAYKTFNMPVNDKPGHRRSLVIFYNGQPTGETDIYRGGDPKCISSWAISGKPFLYEVKRTGKGFEYDEYSENIDNKLNTSVVVYDANGKYLTVSMNKATRGELALLKNKYGYTFPPTADPKSMFRKRDKNGAYVSVGRLNNGAVPVQTITPPGTKALFIVDGKKYEFTPKSLAKYNSKSLLYMSYDKIAVYEQGNAYSEKTWGKGYGKVAVLTGNAALKIVEHPFSNKKETAVIDTISKADVTAFYTHLINNISYPSSERDRGINGRATVEFNVSDDKHINYIKIIKSPSDNLSMEIIRVLKDSPYLKAFKGGSWTLPVAFNLNGSTLPTSYLPISNIVYNPNGFNVPAYVPTQKLTEVVVKGYTKVHIASAARSDLEQLGKYFAQNIRYPAADRKDTIGGNVITVFEIGANNQLLYAETTNSPSGSISNEIIRVLKDCPGCAVLKPGVRYILPVLFRLGYKNTASEVEFRSRGARSLSAYNPTGITPAVKPLSTVMFNPIVIRGYI
jgi:beta-lactamase regulating signal transducer with metallopeptidase domain/outer membrane biosynthesis protein TonB